MDRYFTIMIVPEREKGVKSFRIPRMLFHATALLFVVGTFLLAILAYDYWKILQQVYENKHLTIENRQLKEQIQLFQMKINTLAEDLEKIHVFEQKLRVITGIDNADLTAPLQANDSLDNKAQGGEKKENDNDKDGFGRFPQSNNFVPLDLSNLDLKDKEFIRLQKLYEQKIATTFGLQAAYAYTKDWSRLTQQSFALADQFALFDYKFKRTNEYLRELEVNIHNIDQYLLDRDSFIKSIPTLIPTRGWITSYYGPRISPYSGRVKMHEGLDIGGKIGAPVVAPSDGLVTYAGKKPGFGIYVTLNHGYGIETVYAHSQLATVTKGQKVKRGEIIAHVGNTGYSTGPHVHYEVRINGTPVDPLYYILD